MLRVTDERILTSPELEMAWGVLHGLPRPLVLRVKQTSNHLSRNSRTVIE
jgi:hypothetical protein